MMQRLLLVCAVLIIVVMIVIIIVPAVTTGAVERAIVARLQREAADLRAMAQQSTEAATALLLNANPDHFIKQWKRETYQKAHLPHLLVVVLAAAFYLGVTLVFAIWMMGHWRGIEERVIAEGDTGQVRVPRTADARTRPVQAIPQDKTGN